MDVRSAAISELDQLAEIWHVGWHEAHAELMPEELTLIRTLDSFRERLRAALGEVRAAGPVGAPVGFCMVKGDELYQLFVAGRARGSGVAAALLADAEARLAARGVEVAWLSCAIGNERAARFYRKAGWVCAGTIVYHPDASSGAPIEVWRYEKRLRAGAAAAVRATIHTFRPEHAPAFEALNRSWLSAHGLLEPADEVHLTDPAGQILQPGGQIFVALADGVVVGTCAVVPHDSDTFELVKLSVAPEARGQGLGRELVEACLAFATHHGARQVVLLSNARLGSAVRLYQRLGFRSRPVPPTSPYATADVYMELELRSEAAAVNGLPCRRGPPEHPR